MTPEQFRAVGHRLIDWLADYHASLEGRPPAPVTGPGNLLAELPRSAPAQPGDEREWDRIIADLDRLITPGLLHWQSPRFFGYFPCNCSMPGLLGALVAAGLNVNGMLWATSPAATELEMRLLDWMAEVIGLPESFTFNSPQGGGCIQGTASEAALVALLAARFRGVQAGHEPRALCVYASRHAHSSIIKAAMVAGIAHGPDDADRVRTIACDVGHRMDVEALNRAMREDVANGLVPAYVCATLGTTSSEAIDPLDRIGAAIETLPYRPWLHVDAAYTGAALVCPEFRRILQGVERADSFCFNPHKWLLTNFDCDLMWTRHRRVLIEALSITPEYLGHQSSQSGQVIDYRDWQIPLGRSFRSLKLWFVLRHYGVEGLRAHIRAQVALASWLEQRIRADARFVLAAPRVSGLVCFRLSAGDGPTQRLLQRVNASGEAFISHTKLPDADGCERFVLRVAMGAPSTAPRHVEQLWALLDREADAVSD
ncbi:MAG: aspartate aminotransferase family protein [Leptolyngbya sp. PLA3]|nr:MAG: aspartate aminotransferase family protein [Cyanobacteria bacterium CYA]MCE7967190.1 aspartate aminotransferase family protein [Leptolyngbya sp. PL-A3]